MRKKRYENAFCGLKIHFTRGTLESSQVKKNNINQQPWQLPGYRSANDDPCVTDRHTYTCTTRWWLLASGTKRKKKNKNQCIYSVGSTTWQVMPCLLVQRPIVKVISLIKEVLIIPQLFRTWLSKTLTLPPAQEPHLICPSCVILCISLSFHVQHAISAKNKIKLQQLKLRAKSACVFPLMS